jgi:ribosomal protein S18 acetylase RimI-like enzyme
MTYHGMQPRLPFRQNSRFNQSFFLVAIDQDLVVGSIMAGYDGHRGWLYAAAVLQSHQRRGIGTALVREGENLLSAMGCTKINLQALIEYRRHKVLQFSGI